MEGVRIIDADSHIEEPVEMWDHLDSVGRFFGIWPTRAFGEACERAMDIVRERADLSEKVKRKILSENAASFYNL